MKKILLVATALVLATPALAQSYEPELGSGNIAPSAPSSLYQAPEGAFARVPAAPRRSMPSPALRAPAVYGEHGDVVGADPDPNVRLQLRRDAESIGGF